MDFAIMFLDQVEKSEGILKVEKIGLNKPYRSDVLPNSSTEYIYWGLVLACWAGVREPLALPLSLNEHSRIHKSWCELNVGKMNRVVGALGNS